MYFTMYYTLEVKRWWMPFWYCTYYSLSQDMVEKYANIHANKGVIKQLGRLP